MKILFTLLSTAVTIEICTAEFLLVEVDDSKKSGDVNKINSSTNSLKKPNVIDVTRQDVQDREVEIITCPDTHKYAYANGDWCCKWNKDGNKRYISLASGSCQNIDFNTDFWECPERKSCRNHPSVPEWPFKCTTDSDCPHDLSCKQNECQYPCDFTSCAEEAYCKNENRTAICKCIIGYSGDPWTLCKRLPCAKDGESCKGNYCCNGLNCGWPFIAEQTCHKDETPCTDYFHCKNGIKRNPDACYKSEFKRLCPVTCGCKKCNKNGCEK